MPTDTFTSQASSPWTAPAGVTSVTVEGWGEGGNGGVSAHGSHSGGGGGGGEYAKQTFTVTPGNTYAFTLGAGGTGTDTTCTLNNGTLTAHAGGNSPGQSAGTAGTGSTNTTHFDGGAGAAGSLGSSVSGGGGGSGAGTAAAGGAASGATGGTAPSGGGNGGAGGTSLNAGSNGSSPGGAGGGGGSGGSLNHSGGTGGTGQISFTYSNPITSTGSFGLKKLSFGGTAAENFTTSGSLGLKKLSWGGSALSNINNGSFGLKKLSWGGTAAVSPRASGSFALRKLSFSGTDSENMTSSGHLGLQKLSWGGSAALSFPFPTVGLPAKIELLLNGTWTDITDFVYQRANIVIQHGKPDEQQNVTPSSMTMTLNNRGGRFSPSNTASPYYPYIGRNTQIRVSVQNVSTSSGVVFSGYRFWGEVSAWPPKWDPTGEDVTCDIQAAGVLRRFVQGSPIGSALKRYYKSIVGTTFDPSAVWPCEDASAATLIASLLSGGNAMTFTGSPSFGSDSSFGGSDPLPNFNSSVWTGTTGSDSSPPGTGSIVKTTPGTYTFTPPPGVTSINVTKMVGAGGGGGFYGTAAGGGGGGGGEWVSNSSVAVTPGVTYTYVVPQGGSAAAAAGQSGSDGANATWAGDSHTAIAHGGKGGQPGGSVSGGSGGAGGSASTDTVHHNGGAGGTGQASSSTIQGDSAQGNSGATGGGSGGNAGEQHISWTSPITGTVNVFAVGGGGGGEGGGCNSDGHGGGGGGGGGYATGTISVTAGNTYDFNVGNGGNGNSSGARGDAGGQSGVNGDSGGVFATGGGSGFGAGIGGTGGNGTTSGSNGGNGHIAVTGNGMGGGGGGGGSGQNPGAGGDAPGPNSNPRQPGAGGGNGSGGGWGAVSNGGSGATTGGTGNTPGGGGGGGGAVTNSSGRAGGGGGAGTVSWNWTVTGVPTGGGGGSSGGSGSNGNAGSGTGSGGSAPTGGAAGGAQGAAGSVAGGGGGGGIPDSTSGSGTTATVPGNGAAGEVAFSWNGGSSSPVAANIIRFLLHVDPAGSTDGEVLLRVETYGTINTIDFIYHTASTGQLEVKGYTGGTTYFDKTAAFSALNGKPVMVSLELTASGANATWKVEAIQPGAGSTLATYTGSVSTVTIGNVQDAIANPAGTINDSTAVGWISVQQYADTLVNISPVIAGYAGETVAARISRLCAEEGIGFTLVGLAADTPQMGPQQDAKLLDVLQSCEDMDLGQLWESRDQLGLTYRTRVSLQGQNPAFIMDYANADVAQGLQPVPDDAFIKNDITVTRLGGSSATKTALTGALSILEPPNGVGDYTAGPTVIAFSDSQLDSMATWMLSLGTVDEQRYPQIPVDLSRSEIRDVLNVIAELDVGDFIEIINSPTFLPEPTIQQLTVGYTETMNAFVWTIVYNTVPESPYAQGNPPTW